jgi:predicted enzyme related to lactoylglutathione lyase
MPRPSKVHLRRPAPPNGGVMVRFVVHIGLQTDDLNATVAQVRRAGTTVADPRPTNGIGSRLATVLDRHGIRLEINEQPPGSVMRNAMDAWK